ncbi:MAG: peptidyl-prolyl cis-trans isomerase [Ilumatobacteraceae bacterium]|nr:peptidyl-prolyl cis-trans isomerase [Ilumatobacteraceae bacterium]
MFRRFAIPTALAGLLVLASCGSSGTSSGTATTAPGSATPGSVLPDVTLLPGPTDAPASTVPHPHISVPAAIPTQLTTTVIKPGNGTPSKAGDSVVVNYVGARSADGTEFDNSYDSGTPLTVAPVGQAQLIDGFNQGLIGVQTGEQLQLDIPNSLAYGDQAQGDVIKAGDALSFVIDVLAVFPSTTIADEPKVDVQGAENAPDLATTDLVVGTGSPLTTGQHVAIQIVAYRGDTGERAFSTWEQGIPIVFGYGIDDLLPGLVQGLDGMNVGGRREMRIPYAQAFGEAGNETLGLPGATDVVLVVDVVGTF